MGRQGHVLQMVAFTRTCYVYTSKYCIHDPCYHYIYTHWNRNFAQDRVPISYQALFVMVVGGFNILAGIISTIQQFLKVTQLTEAHRVASIAWDKFTEIQKLN